MMAILGSRSTEVWQDLYDGPSDEKKKSIIRIGVHQLSSNSKHKRLSVEMYSGTRQSPVR
jgi:hypothetical protein